MVEAQAVMQARDHHHEIARQGCDTENVDGPADNDGEQWARSRDVRADRNVHTLEDCSHGRLSITWDRLEGNRLTGGRGAFSLSRIEVLPPLDRLATAAKVPSLPADAGRLLNKAFSGERATPRRDLHLRARATSPDAKPPSTSRSIPVTKPLQDWVRGLFELKRGA